jgi:hypothetical protein
LPLPRTPDTGVFTALAQLEMRHKGNLPQMLLSARANGIDPQILERLEQKTAVGGSTLGDPSGQNLFDPVATLAYQDLLQGISVWSTMLTDMLPALINQRVARVDTGSQALGREYRRLEPLREERQVQILLQRGGGESLLR